MYIACTVLIDERMLTYADNCNMYIACTLLIDCRILIGEVQLWQPFFFVLKLE
jgi:hypothetical protein